MGYSSGRFDSVMQWSEAVTLIRSYLSHGDHTLDFGCGNGGATSKLAKTVSPSRVIGVDINRHHVEQARVSHPQLSFRSYGWLLNNDVKFDRIVCLHSLPLVRDVNECLALLGDRLADHGQMLLTLPGVGYHTFRRSTLVDNLPKLWTVREARALCRCHGLHPLETRTFGSKLLWFPQHVMLVITKGLDKA